MTPVPIFNVNEVNVVAFLLLALSGRRPYVAGVAPFLPRMTPLLQPIVDWTTRSGRAKHLIDTCPELHPIRDYYAFIYMHNIFEPTESWQDDYFRFAAADVAVPGYAMAYKHATCSYMRVSQMHILLIDAAERAFADRAVRFHGLPPESVGLFEAYFKRPPRAEIRTTPCPQRLVNGLLSLMIAAYTVAWVFRRTRLRVPAEHLFMAVDYVSDPRDVRLINELADGGDFLLIPRNRKVYGVDHTDNLTVPFEIRDVGEGLFNPGMALRTIAMVVGDGWSLLRHFAWLQPQHFFHVATLPYRRALFRGLFNRFRVKAFWGRDESNPEHIIRRQELNRVGAKAFGVQHGSPSHAIIQPMWRYISLDTFYVFGRAIYDKYWRHTWAQDMTVKAVGSFGARRPDYGLINRPRPKNILVMASLFFAHAAFAETVRALGEAFPDRTIFIQVKRRFKDWPACRAFVAESTRGLSNVVYTDDMIFDLFAKCRYAFADPSTTVLEALQFGVISYFLDVAPEQQACIYRDYPDLCVTSPDEAVRRIREIESGEGPYPREKFADLVDLSGAVFHDTVREDLGLAPAAACRKDATMALGI